MPSVLRSRAHFLALALATYVVFLCLAPGARAQQTINVPAAQPTIQAGINGANTGDTVLVAPGTYTENINFNGKAITVTSSGGPSVTIIDGNANGSVVTFDTNETSGSVLSGFTIQNGFQSGSFGAGISITNASPTISGNVITRNHAAAGIGIYINGGSAIVQGNTITGNNQTGAGDGGSGGGGILVAGGSSTPSAPQIIGNTITNNNVGNGGQGGGISVTYFSSPLIQANLIQGNTAFNSGGGVSLDAYNSPILIQNVIVNNTAGSGGGLYAFLPSGSTELIVNNTIAGNTAGDNSYGVFAGGFGEGATYINNLIVAQASAVTCDSTYSPTSPTFSYTDAFSTSGQSWSGICDSTSQPGNISADPLFINTAVNDFHLKSASPGIDAGSNSGPNLPATDFDGNPRIADGNSDGVATIDLGAYEMVPTAAATITPLQLTFGPQFVGSSSTPQSVTLSSTGTTPFQITSVQATGDFSQTTTCVPASVPTGNSCTYAVSFVPTASGARTGTLLVGGSNGQLLSVTLSGTGSLQAPTTTTVTSGSNPSSYAVPMTFTATVQFSSGSTPTGTVTFLDGSSTLGTATLSGTSAQFATSTLTAGSHTITATYNGDANFQSSTGTVTQTVNPGATTTVLTFQSIPPVYYGQYFSMSAQITPANGSLTLGQVSSVTFYDGTTLLGTQNTTSSTAALAINTLNAGLHTITAQWSGAPNYAPSTSNTITESVVQVSSTATVYDLRAPFTYGTAGFVTAQLDTPYHVTGSGGTITLFDNGNSVATNPMSQGTAFFPQSLFTAGTHSLRVSYSGDSNLAASNSTAYTLTVNKAAATTAITSNANPATVGQSVTLTATLAPPSGTTATGTITFLDGATTLGAVAVTNNSAQFTASNLTTGSHSITAQYSGDTNFSGSTSSALSETVNLSSVNLTVSSNNNPSVYGQSVTFTVSAQPLAGSITPTGTITFLDGTTTLGTSVLSGGAAQLPASALAVGSHSITAKYSGDINYAAGTSSAFTQTVNQASTSVTLISSANPGSFAQTLVLTATVQPPAGTTASGSITFMDGATTLSSATLSNNAAQFSISTLAIGSHSLTAVYSGNANLAASTSASLTETIAQSSTSVSLTTSLNPATYGVAVTFVATVQTPTGGPATGTFSFFDGSTLIVTTPVNNNGVQHSSANLTVGEFQGGTHSITAVYSGDSNYTGSTSPAVVETINPAASTTSIASSLNPATSGQNVTLTASVQSSVSGSLTTGSVTFFDGANVLGSVNLALPSQSVQLAVSNLAVGTHSLTAKYNGDRNFSVGTSSVLTETVNPIVSTGLAIDAQVFKDQTTAKTSVATSAFSTTASNELLLAFVATDFTSGTNTTVTSITGGGLTWTLVLRSNKQSGTSEIWRAFASTPLSGITVTANLSHSVVSSITVVSFTGADTTGTGGSGAIGATKATNAASGAPTASLTTTRNNSWVFGVGNDFDNAVARTVGTGQTLIHQYLSSTGDTYWMQRQNGPTTLSGTSLAINDTAPTGDRYNLAICEILPAQ
jgi:hypothetical protein